MQRIDKRLCVVSMRRRSREYATGGGKCNCGRASGDCAHCFYV